MSENWNKNKMGNTKSDTAWKSNLLRHLAVRDLYQRRVNKHIERKPMSIDVEVEWKEFKELTENVASGVLGKRKKYQKNKSPYVWNENLKH